MGYITVNKIRVRDRYYGWGNWSDTDSQGSGYINLANKAHVVFSADVTRNGGEYIKWCYIEPSFTSANDRHAATLSCYMYTSDPTSLGQDMPPSGYIARSDCPVSIPGSNSYLRQTFAFNDLNISGASKLYFWITDAYDSSFSDSVSYNALSGSAFETTSNKALSLSLDHDNVSTGDEVVVTVNNNTTTLRMARVWYGQTLLASSYEFLRSTGINCQKEWFDTLGITKQKHITLTVKGPGCVNFILSAGDDMRPIVGRPSASVVPATRALDFSSTFIANVSKAKIEASVTTPSSAAISTVMLTYYGGNVEMTYNQTTGKYEATTPGPLTGDTTFVVTATDERGLSGSNTLELTGVVPYAPPTVVFDTDDTYRCNSQGEKSAGGLYYRVKVDASYYHSGDLADNELEELDVRIKGDDVNVTDLTSGTQSAAIAIPGTPSTSLAYVIVVTVKDEISSAVTRELKLEGNLRNVVITRSDSGTYVGVGRDPGRSSGPSSIELPAGGQFLVGNEPIVNQDLSVCAAKSFTLVGTTDSSQANPSIDLPASFSELIVEWADTRNSFDLVYTAHVCASQLGSTARIFAYGEAANGDGTLACKVSLTAAVLDISNAPPYPSQPFTMSVYYR